MSAQGAQPVFSEAHLEALMFASSLHTDLETPATLAKRLLLLEQEMRL